MHSGLQQIERHFHKALPRPRVEDVEVGVADGRSEGLVRQVSRPSGQRCHPPLEVAGRRVPPGAGVPIKGALGPDERGLFRHC